MKFWLLSFVALVALLSICAPEQFIAVIQSLNEFFRSIGITSFDDIASSVQDLLDELKGFLK